MNIRQHFEFKSMSHMKHVNIMVGETE